MFFENDDKSYTMLDLYLNNRFQGTKIHTIVMLLMLMKYYYLKKVIINIFLDITM